MGLIVRFLVIAVCGWPLVLGAVESDQRLTDFLGQEVGDLSFAGVQRDAGIVPQGQEVTFEFPYEVKGPGSVTILGVHQECGCLSQSLKAGQILGAGKLGKFVIRADTSQFVGNFDKLVTILTNEEGETRSEGMYTFRVKAQIQRTLKINPPLVEMKFSPGKIPPTATVRIEGISKQSLHIEKVAYNEDNFKVEYFPVRDAWELKITWKGEAPLSPRFETIEVVTDGSVKHLRIPVVGSLVNMSH